MKYLNQIICGDSRDLLKELPDKSVHMVITSPPYNVGINYDSSNDRLSKNDYRQMLNVILKECYRILVDGGRIALVCPSCARQSINSKEAYIAVYLHNILNEIGYSFFEWICWDKKFGSNDTSWGSFCSPSAPYLRDVVEYIIIASKKKLKLDGDPKKIDITKDEFLRWTVNLWQISPTTEKSSGHPAAFPPEIPYRLIKLYTYQDNIILDPFCGSGTTCYVAKLLKRNYIGFDISENYCKIARNKIAQEYLDL